MKISYRLMLGYLTAAILGVECCITPKILPASAGGGDGNRSVETILVQSRKLSYLRSASGEIGRAHV